MKRFRRILVAPVTTGLEPPAALHEAVALADASGASVEILGHLPSAVASTNGSASAHRSQFADTVRSAYLERLGTWAEQVGAPDLPIHIGYGQQPGEIANRVENQAHDLVVVAGDGSVESATAARRILRTCPCPVWLLRPSFRGSRVLAAIDPDHDKDHNELILALAQSQASIHGGDLRVLHAWDLPELEILEHSDRAPDRDQLSTFVTETEATHRQAFVAAMETADIGAGVETHLVDGPAAQAIHGLTELYRIDLIVLGAGAWSQPRLGLGSTAEQVVTEADCSVLVVRDPAG